MRNKQKNNNSQMLREKESVLQNATILLDASLLVFAFFVALFIRQNLHTHSEIGIIRFNIMIPESTASVSDYLVILFITVPMWCIILHLNGMYRSMRTRKLHKIVWIIIKSSFFLVITFGAVVFLLKLMFVSRLFLVIFVTVGLLFFILEKVLIYLAMNHVRKRGYNYRRLLIVGTGRRAVNVIKKICSHPEWGLKIIGSVDDEPGRGIEKVDAVDVVGAISDLQNILHEKAIDEVIFVVPRSRLNHIEDAVYICETEGVKATIAVDLFNLKIAKSHPSDIEDIPLISFETTVAREWELFIKRILDIVLSGIGIILLSPLLIIVALLIKITSPGPVYFKQERLGLNNRRFTLYKFRTMRVGSENELASINVNHDMNDPSFKKKKMLYITPFGRFLRKFSIDELPQLYNVFLGHMSLVGPRPSVPEEVKQHKPWQRRRMSMRPGITCLWQVSGRNKIKFEDWMKLDLEYLDNWSLGLDLKILIKTIPVVIFGIGAY